MGFVKTAGEIEQIQHAVSAVEFNGGVFLGIEFLSDPEFIEKTLPPGIQPAGDNKMTAMTCTFAGGSCGSFSGGAVYIAARHGDIFGSYTLAMYMDSDNAMLFGRDIYGEPKKLAAVEQIEDGDTARGSVTRGGVKLIDIEARFDSDGEMEGLFGQDFNYKVSLAADGIGLAGDPQLTLTRLDMEISHHRTGMGSLRLAGTAHDPLDEIPVRQAVGAQIIKADYRASSRVLQTVPAAEFLPYAYGRLPDWSVFMKEWNALRRKPARS